MKYIRQDGLRDCGINCLYNIIRYYGGNIDIEKLRLLTKTNENGTSIYNLVKVSNNLGFNSKAYHCELKDLKIQEYPLIAYIKINDYYHFVIVEDLCDDKVMIFDPIRGYINYSENEFLKEWQKIIITYEKKGEIINEKSYYELFLINLIKDNRIPIIIICIISLICSINSLILSIFLKELFDGKVKNIFTFIFLIIIKCIFDFTRNFLSIKFNNKIDKDLSSNIYNKLFNLPITFHHNRLTGDISSRINDLNNIKKVISTFTFSSVIDILLIIIILILVTVKCLILLPLILLLIALIIGIYYFFKKDEIMRLESVKNANSTNNSIFIDNLTGIDTIKNMNIEDKIINKQNKSLLNFINCNNDYNLLLNMSDSIINFIELIGLIIVMFKSYSLLKSGTITIGDMTFIYTLYITLIGSIKNLIFLDKNISESKLSFYRINNLLNISDIEQGGKKIKNVDKIEFIDSEIFNSKASKFNMLINKNENVFITGKSGIGKSNLFKSLIKESRLGYGIIKINDIDITDIKESSIIDNITYVSQNEHIFNDTIKNNILMYKSHNTKELNKVLKVSMVDKFLKKKNINLDYLLEENGSNLSGGERQKILIARALLNNSKFIIFDETMNEIDIESERKIINYINTEYNKTIILISHRDNNSDLFNKKVFIE